MDSIRTTKQGVLKCICLEYPVQRCQISFALCYFPHELFGSTLFCCCCPQPPLKGPCIWVVCWGRRGLVRQFRELDWTASSELTPSGGPLRHTYLRITAPSQRKQELVGLLLKECLIAAGLLSSCQDPTNFSSTSSGSRARRTFYFYPHQSVIAACPHPRQLSH